MVTKFILPSLNNLRFLLISFNETCDYLAEENGHNHKSIEYISDLRIYCKKIVPFVYYYNCTMHSILMNEIFLILPNLLKDRKEKRSIIALLIKSFIGLEYDGISSFLCNRRHEALDKTVVAMENKLNLQCNKLIHLEDSTVMYGLYNAETLEKLITTVH